MTLNVRRRTAQKALRNASATCKQWAKLGLKCGAALCLASYAAYGATILYTFSATTRDFPGSPSHLEKVELATQDFLPVEGGLISFIATDPAIITCIACKDSPTIPAVHFLRGSGSDLVQFADGDGTTRAYFFPLGALSSVGNYNTLPGINVAVGSLAVAEAGGVSAVPEPATVATLATGLAGMALAVRRRRAGMKCTNQEYGDAQVEN